ncbi:SANT/Myb domain [Arabidopsis thaliana x Arabidopsis arenosa]|uniref:SANT/Myb domain n=1 Tax=Arabidopsis thaliana x Arabidopsis arenosa TaxID=1240361 RepID=A0A8T2A622_9BRAS|nr:SANT/Myb domain [Arabidopsis thaliana x Arabidopsis arenosa]
MKKNYTIWTQEEDKLLKDYVNQHGDVTWTDVPKHTGLSHTAKSCRFRWVNYLRPGLKRGPFTEEEEQRVIELQTVLGNKWAQMSKELPGRTDNEIKNFWNVRRKKLKRLGLPVYPDKVRKQAISTALRNGLKIDLLDAQDLLMVDNVEKPDAALNNLPLNQCSPYYQSMLANVQPREPETTFPFTNGYVMNEQNPNLLNYLSVDSTQEQLPDSHLFGNAIYSSPPMPLIHGVGNLELPSFQGFNAHEEPSSFGAEQYNPMMNLEPHNTLVQPPIGHSPTDFPSSFYDELLESLVYGSVGERPKTDTSSELPPFPSSLLSHTEVTPPIANTIDLGFVGPTSSVERNTTNDDDWIRELLDDDTYNTK